MPLYDFRCRECFSTWEASFTISERDTPVNAPCPHCHAPGVVERFLPANGHGGFGYSHRAAGPKTPEGFKDILRKIKSEHRGSTINV